MRTIGIYGAEGGTETTAYGPGYNDVPVVKLAIADDFDGAGKFIDANRGKQQYNSSRTEVVCKDNKCLNYLSKLDKRFVVDGQPNMEAMLSNSAANIFDRWTYKYLLNPFPNGGVGGIY
jgi:hypothetical protein